MEFQNVQYIKNYDGDTITVNISEVHPLLGLHIPVRVRGIDTDEMRDKTKSSIDAQLFVHGILSHAKKIDLRNVGRCKYFRILADVIVDGVSLADMIIKKGYSKLVEYP
jgi:endonuclease YncB( thermonuclease family)